MMNVRKMIAPNPVIPASGLATRSTGLPQPVAISTLTTTMASPNTSAPIGTSHFSTRTSRAWAENSSAAPSGPKMPFARSPWRRRIASSSRRSSAAARLKLRCSRATSQTPMPRAKCQASANTAREFSSGASTKQPSAHSVCSTRPPMQMCSAFRLIEPLLETKRPTREIHAVRARGARRECPSSVLCGQPGGLSKQFG
jgi:hypothetical protein